MLFSSRSGFLRNFHWISLLCLIDCPYERLRNLKAVVLTDSTHGLNRSSRVVECVHREHPCAGVWCRLDEHAIVHDRIRHGP